VARDEDGMRLDRWFGTHFPQVTFGHLQKLIRTGQVRIDSGRAKTNSRLESGQVVRVPPLETEVKRIEQKIDAEDARYLRDLILYEDDELFVFNKPSGLASQGGSGTKRHMDGLLKSLPNKAGEAPRLVHRLDRDTSGVLVVAKTRAAASYLGKVFQSRSARKIYWAIVYGNPKPSQGSISCFLAKEQTEDGEQMIVVEQNYEGAQHSLTYYSTTDVAARRFAWVTLKPVTGRTHQLRVHMQQLGNPIIGDPRYFNIENWQGAPGLGEGLHLHARRIRLPLKGGKLLDVSAPLSPHMQQSFEALGFDPNRYDARDQDPEDA
jgi:23S rRNA pseudouridine955/2504/2580 synthase